MANAWYVAQSLLLVQMCNVLCVCHGHCSTVWYRLFGARTIHIGLSLWLGSAIEHVPIELNTTSTVHEHITNGLRSSFFFFCFLYAFFFSSVSRRICEREISISSKRDSFLGRTVYIWNVMWLHCAPAENMDGFVGTKNALTHTLIIHIRTYLNHIGVSSILWLSLSTVLTLLHSMPHKFNVSIALIAAYHCILLSHPTPLRHNIPDSSIFNMLGSR